MFILESFHLENSTFLEKNGKSDNLSAPPHSSCKQSDGTERWVPS